ncbi:Cytochrome P450 [Mycena chlorophos]|uniref:Cytochrome P450 n=1 Tax=Mycena chlorophos TaxID=658473 RepID=A0A8H6WGG8_MYCCL|nr:Cytochrome P450 [Mycena chlorophos]
MYRFLAACTALISLAAFVVRRRSATARRLINSIPGPKPTSWMYGSLVDLFITNEYGENEFKWQDTYGPVYTLKGCFGETRLMISDPATVKFVLNSPAFVSGATQQKAANALFGYGSVFMAQGTSALQSVMVPSSPPSQHPRIASGTTHKYLRGLMNPWFSAKNVRSTLPIMQEVAHKLVEHWEHMGFPGSTVDVTRSMGDAAIDIVGDAIFEHPFNGLSGKGNLSKTQRGLVNSMSSASRSALLTDFCLKYIPDFVFGLAVTLPLPGTQMLRDYHRMTDELGSTIVRQKRDTLHGAKDDAFVTGLLRTEDDPYNGVPDEQIAVHLRTILFAGEDTTVRLRVSEAPSAGCSTNSQRCPNTKKSLREEIDQVSGDIDYDSLPLLNAIINVRVSLPSHNPLTDVDCMLQEALRIYPALPMAERVAAEDCVLPLSQPITTKSGEEITHIPIQKGQYVYVAIGSYHRLRSIWGEDAAEFKPSRWLESEQPCKGTALGPYASLLTFLAGHGVCLGWRFAVQEIQVLVVEIVRNFVLSLPADNTVRAQCFGLTLVPKTADGVQHIPLHVEHVHG